MQIQYYVQNSVRILPRAPMFIYYSICLNNNDNREPEWNTIIQNYQYSHQSAFLRDRCQCTHIWTTLQWRHNEHHGVSKHRCIDCLLSRLFRRRSKKTSKPCATGLCEGNSPDKGPVTRNMFPSDDVMMTDANGGWNKQGFLPFVQGTPDISSHEQSIWFILKYWRPVTIKYHC